MTGTSDVPCGPWLPQGEYWTKATVRPGGAAGGFATGFPTATATAAAELADRDGAARLGAHPKVDRRLSDALVEG
jgi:hypothetical protein